MKNKIFITGASGAFGFLTCKTLVEKGYSVVGTMRSTKGKNEKVAHELQSMGVQLVAMDVTDETSVNDGVTKAIELLGGLDVVFNNAGVGSYGIQEHFTAEDMMRVFDINVFGVQRVMRAVLPYLRTQGKGTILYTSSLIGRITTPFYGTYCASKWALEAIVESYRSELAAFGIESCIVEPGPMPTPFFDAMLKPSDTSRNEAYGEMSQALQPAYEGLQQALQSNPEQRPQKIADAVADLLDLPFGEKPFRTIVDHMGIGEPIARYNELLHNITREIYTGFGNDAMLSLNQ